MLLSGKRPFHHQDKREKARMIRHDALRFPSPEWDRVSSEAKDFCSSLMQKKPRDRLSATAAKDHPWIKHASRLHAGADAAHELARHQEIVESLEQFCEADDLKKLALEVPESANPAPPRPLSPVPRARGAGECKPRPSPSPLPRPLSPVPSPRPLCPVPSPPRAPPRDASHRVEASAPPRDRAATARQGGHRATGRPPRDRAPPSALLARAAPPTWRRHGSRRR